LNVEKDNIEHLIKDMEKLKKAWKTVLKESKKYTTENVITPEFDINRRLKYAEYNKIINATKDGLKRRFQSISSICSYFEVLWKFNYMDQDDIISKATLLVDKYKNEISIEIIEELILLKCIYAANFKYSTKPVELLK